MGTPADEIDRHGLDEDLRVAVVMNGGVSLAIWIGGVSAELNYLTQSRIGDGSVYGALRELMRCTARVDVIAGTSAGGINGAFLALAEVYCANLDALGAIWAEEGGLLDLLRSATESDPPSLLKGDEYFLPELRKAFESIAPPNRVGPVSAAARDAVPIHLTMTASVLNGSVKQFRDDFGTRILEVEHKGRFTFVRHETKDDDPFTRPEITAQLALASRSTASFPVAFEPSYVPVGESPDDLHPDMRGRADFGASRYVLDGGVLLNKPVRPALDAILSMPADRQVRRVLAYVVPDPGLPVEAKPDKREDLPTVAKVLADSIVALPRAQSIVEELDELRAHNRKARDRAAVGLELASSDGDEVERLAEAVFPVYRMARARRAAAAIAEILGAEVPGTKAASTPWSYEDLLVAFGADDASAMPRPLPFAPERIATPAAGRWGWGLAPAERLAWLALDLIRRALAVVPRESPLRADLAGYRRQVHDLRQELRERRDADRRFWTARAAELEGRPADPVRATEVIASWLDESLALWPVADPGAAARRAEARRAIDVTALRLVDLLVEVAPVVAAAADPAAVARVDAWLSDDATRVRRRVAGLRLLPAAKAGRRGGPRTVRQAALRRLLAMEVVELAVSRCPQDLSDPVDLVQVSGDTPNGFGGPAAVADKLAGVQMGHFGAFYKRSWRVNDWIWGRLDGATRVTQILLDPVRVRRLWSGNASGFVAALREIAVGDDPGLAKLWDDDAAQIAAEVAYLDRAELQPPPSLIAASLAVARRIQANALENELPRLADAVRADEREGAPSRGAGADFVAGWDAGGDRLDAAGRLALFAKTRIASERITDEVGTDLFARTVSRAAAVGVATADSNKSGLGGARLVTRTLRGFTMLLYALVAGATAGSKVGAWFVNAALAAGGALLAVALLVPDVAGPVKGLAALLVLAGLALSAVRSRVWVLALVLGIPLAALVALTVVPEGRAALAKHATVIWVTFGLVLAMMAVGSARTPRTSPWPSRLPRRPRWWRKTVDAVGSPVPRWLRWALAAVASTAAVVAAFVWMEQKHSPDVVRLELWAWSPERAAEILATWAHQAGGLARGESYVLRDFAFLATYWVFGAVFVRLAGMALAATVRPDKGPRAFVVRLAGAATALSWLPLVVAALDAVENGLLLAQLRSVRDAAVATYATAIPDHLPALTTAAAAWKWLLVLVCLGYVAVCAVTAGVRAALGVADPDDA